MRASQRTALVLVVLVAFCATSVLAKHHGEKKKGGMFSKALDKLETFTQGSLDSVNTFVNEHKRHRREHRHEHDHDHDHRREHRRENRREHRREHRHEHRHRPRPIDSTEIPEFVPGFIMPEEKKPERIIDSTEVPDFVPGFRMPEDPIAPRPDEVEMAEVVEAARAEPMINNVVYDPEKYGVHEEEEKEPLLNMINPFSKKEDEVEMAEVRPAGAEGHINNVVFDPEKYGVQKEEEEPVLNMQHKLVAHKISGLLKKAAKPKSVLRKAGNFQAQF